MLKTPNRNRLPWLCQIKAVDPAFRSMSIPRWPKDLRVVGSVYRAGHPDTTRGPFQASRSRAERRGIWLRVGVHSTLSEAA